MVRAIQINHVDLSNVKDGICHGRFTYGVAVTVAGDRIDGVAVVKNRATTRAMKAEDALMRIVEHQRNDMDAVSGATTTSKALLKAVERALSTGLQV